MDPNAALLSILFAILNNDKVDSYRIADLIAWLDAEGFAPQITITASKTGLLLRSPLGERTIAWEDLT